MQATSKIEITLLGGKPTEEEAAALVAVAEALLSEASGQSTAAAQRDPWRSAALLEGVSRSGSADLPEPWIKT
jgi:Acyl-CoA carboxylase epsilon subunit